MGPTPKRKGQNYRKRRRARDDRQRRKQREIRALSQRGPRRMSAIVRPPVVHLSDPLTGDRQTCCGEPVTAQTRLAASLAVCDCSACRLVVRQRRPRDSSGSLTRRSTDGA